MQNDQDAARVKSLEGMSAKSKIFAGLVIIGAEAIGASVVWGLIRTAKIPDHAPGFDTRPAPVALGAILLAGSCCLVVGVSGLLRSKWILRVSLLGTALMIGGIAWLYAWKHFSLTYDSTHRWDAPDAAYWLTTFGFGLLGASVLDILLVAAKTNSWA